MIQSKIKDKIPEIVPKNYKSNLVSKKIKSILPELLERNKKLSDRLKSKLKVSTFFNNAENRNQKYIKYFLDSSDKRLKDIKTGLELSKAIKQSYRNLSNLCEQLDNDIILQNSNFLTEEKKLLKENTEQETHMKINNLIANLKNTVKKNNLYYREQKNEKLNYLSKSYINNAKNILENKFDNENKVVNYRINSYKVKLNNSLNDKKEFKNFAEHFDISNLKLLNYQKPKPIPVIDRECSNMLRIKNYLYPSNDSKEPDIKKKIINLKNKSMQQNYSFNEFGKSQILDNDTFCVLKGLASNGKNLPLKIDKTSNKVNSLLDIDLPNPETYKKLLKKSREDQMGKKNFDLGINDNMYPIDEFEQLLRNQQELDKHVKNKVRLQKIINTFKNEISKLKNYQLGFERKIENKNKKKNKLMKQRPIILLLNKIEKMKKNENSIINDQTTSIMTKKIKEKENNPNMNSNKKENFSSFFSNSSRISKSFSIKDYKNMSQSFISGYK